MKALLFPILIILACSLAGLYGILHNQISYTVSAGYFHEFKFIQFNIDPTLQNRLGASLVGFYASWWMGIIIGIPIYLTCLFVKGLRPFIKTYISAAGLVIAVTLFVGLAALLVSYFSISTSALPWWMTDRPVSDPVAFARAGTMHNYSYLGGILGLVAGLIYTVLLAWKSRRQKRPTGSTN